MACYFEETDAPDRRDAMDRNPVVWAGPVAVFILTTVSVLAWLAFGALVQAIL